MTRDAVTSDQLPASGLPFSVAVRGGGLLFLSGQVAQDPATGELVDGDIAQQADQILRNIAATLAAIGKDLDDVIRVGVYLTDMSQFGAMNEAYRRHFAEPYPARTAIGVAALPLGAAVEMAADSDADKSGTTVSMGVPSRPALARRSCLRPRLLDHPGRCTLLHALPGRSTGIKHCSVSDGHGNQAAPIRR